MRLEKELYVYVVTYQIDGVGDVSGVYLWEDDAEEACNTGNETGVGDWFYDKYEVTQ